MPKLLIVLMLAGLTGCANVNVKETMRLRTFDLYSETGHSNFGSGKPGRSSYKEWIIGGSLGWEVRYNDENKYREKREKRIKLIEPKIQEVIGREAANVKNDGDGEIR